MDKVKKNLGDGLKSKQGLLRFQWTQSDTTADFPEHFGGCPIAWSAQGQDRFDGALSNLV